MKIKMFSLFPQYNLLSNIQEMIQPNNISDESLQAEICMFPKTDSNSHQQD